MHVQLNLEGLNGNAFALLSAFQKAARKQGYAEEEIQAVMVDATSGDYDHLLAVLIRNTVADDEG